MKSKGDRYGVQWVQNQSSSSSAVRITQWGDRQIQNLIWDKQHWSNIGLYSIGQVQAARRSGGLYHVLMQSISKLYQWLMSYDWCWVDVDSTGRCKPLIAVAIIDSMNRSMTWCVFVRYVVLDIAEVKSWIFKMHRLYTGRLRESGWETRLRQSTSRLNSIDKFK